MRALGLDVGDERIGIALSDALGTMARPLEVIARSAGAASFQRIAALVAEHAIARIVVGLPLLPGGSEGKQVASVRAYVRGLQTHVTTSIVYWDERDSSNEAARILADNAVGHRRQRRRQDAVAAAVILQDYLDQHAGESS